MPVSNSRHAPHLMVRRLRTTQADETNTIPPHRPPLRTRSPSSDDA